MGFQDEVFICFEEAAADHEHVLSQHAAGQDSVGVEPYGI
jgi:hypothetical protein